MTKYKRSDKVVINLDALDAELLENKRTIICFSKSQVLGKLEDFQPAEEKIKFTVEEKREFDKLKDGWTGIFRALDSIVVSRYPKLYAKLFTKPLSYKEQNKVLIEFARAWANPELIEVIGETVKTIQVGGRNLWGHDGEYSLVNHCDINNEHYYFTKSEIEKISKLEQFKYIDLVGAWEDGE